VHYELGAVLIRSIIAGICLVLLLSSFAFPTTYYVDSKSGRDDNNGTSIASPWKTISKVNSFHFNAGDEILFKRGEVWKETIIVNRDGSSSSPIIYGAYGSGEPPLLDGSSSREYGIHMINRKHIVIEGFNIRNTKGSSVRIQKSETITIRDNEMFVTGRAGVFIEESANSLISGNNMSTPSNSYNVQTDGIYGQRNSFITYDGNKIVISNQHVYQHCDAIQLYLEESATIKNNYIEQNNTKSGNAQGIYCSVNSGTFRIYNNVGYGMFTTSGLIKFINLGISSGKAEIVNNTLYGGGGGLFQTDDTQIIFKNNIIASEGSNPLVVFSKAVGSKSDVNYNLYRNNRSGSNVIFYKGKVYNLSDWKKSGFGQQSLEGDPRFVNVSLNDFNLNSNSPAVDKGVNLNAPYNEDHTGTLRPSGSGTDMGAFEWVAVPEVYSTGLKKGLGNEEEESIETAPEVFELVQNYPNPFNPSTTISFSLPENSMVTLKIYDITGSEVAVLVNDFRNAGVHQVKFDASALSSGTYLYRITAKDFTETRKMILAK
jgi:hypothetical protein